MRRIFQHRGVCPQCKVNDVIREKLVGSMPRCTSCLESNREGRNVRAQIARKQGKRLSHHDVFGRRYDRRKLKIKCLYCGSLIDCREYRKGQHTPVCAKTKCKSTHKDVTRRRRLAGKLLEYEKDVYNHVQLSRRLRRIGRDVVWYDQAVIGGCGICGSLEANGKGLWHLDHDHKCCNRGCNKCFRGILCHYCNVGLGLFRDNPDALRKAALWVSKARII